MGFLMFFLYYLIMGRDYQGVLVVVKIEECGLLYLDYSLGYVKIGYLFIFFLGF